MSHIYIVLHLLAFTSGIGLITITYFIYIKNKTSLIKKVIRAELFYAAYLAIDTIDLYSKKIILTHYRQIHSYTSIALIIAGIGLLFYLANMIFYLKSFRHKNCPTAISLITNLKQKNYIIKFLILILSVLSLLLVITNSFKNLPLFLYKIPYTPSIYFIVNILGLAYIKNCSIYPEENTSSESDLEETEENNISKYFIDLCTEHGITDREKDVIKYIIEGCNNQEISEKLFISSNTVRNHIYNIYRKMGIKNRYELISIVNNHKTDDIAKSK